MHKDQIDSQIEITFQLIIYQISTWNISELCGFLSCRYTEKIERPLDPEHAITFNIFKKSFLLQKQWPHHEKQNRETGLS